MFFSLSLAACRTKKTSFRHTQVLFAETASAGRTEDRLPPLAGKMHAHKKRWRTGPTAKSRLIRAADHASHKSSTKINKKYVIVLSIGKNGANAPIRNFGCEQSIT